MQNENKGRERKTKSLGQVFTPQWIVEEILDLVGYSDGDILQKKVLEPACGDGAFLQGIVRRYVNIARKSQLPDEEIAENLETFIFGIEIDASEYEKCINNLDRIACEEFQLRKIRWQIFNENTLHIYKNYLKEFDFIVGNPPYIRVHNLDIAVRQQLKQDFLFADGTTDLYLAFFEMGFKMLNINGLLGFITPNSWLHNASYKSFREHLKSQKMVHTIIDFKANKLFKGISSYTAISIFQNQYQEAFFTYKELIDNKIEFVNQIHFAALNNQDWSFATDENAHFLARLSAERQQTIKEFFDVQYGFATLRDKIFIGKISEEIDDNLVLFNGKAMEKSILKTVVKGSRFRGKIDENEKIIFPYELKNGRYRVISEEKMARDFPNCFRYFLSHKAELQQRDIDKNALWYEFGRSQDVQTMHHEKIVLSTLMFDKIDFYRLPKDVLIYSGIFIIQKTPHSDWNIIEETLKSEEFFRYIRLTGKDFSGGYKSITSKQIKNFKIDCGQSLTLKKNQRLQNTH